METGAAFFGAPGEIVFGSQEKDLFIYRIKEDGSQLVKMIPTSNLIPFAVSPDGQWVSAQTPNQYADSTVYPAGGDPPTLICGNCTQPQGVDLIPPPVSWTPDGKFVYLKFGGSTYAIALQPGQMLPPIPAKGFPSKDAVAALPGARLISSEIMFPGPNPSIYAFVRVSTHRNIYRIPVP